MALQRVTDTRPLMYIWWHQRVGGRLHCEDAMACALVKQCDVQILVAVATIQPRTLKTEEEKVSM